MNDRENPILDLFLALILLAAVFNVSLPTVLLFTARVSQKIGGAFGRVGFQCETAAYKLNRERALS